MSKKPSVIPPLRLKVLPPKTSAGGIAAVRSVARHILQEMSPQKGLRLLLQVNQKKGFDCPGCAWPDPDQKRSPIGEFCENGAKAIAEEGSQKKVGASFFAQHSVEELRTWSDYQLGKSGRLIEPLVLKEEEKHYRSIPWEEAFQLIAQNLQALSHPDQAVFYTSGRTSNEAAFLYQLFVRQFGTNNLPDCSNMCHESSGAGLSETLGIGKGSVTLEDFYQSEVILIMGQNPGTNHPRMLSALQKAKEKGAKIVSVNPLAESGLIRFKNPQSFRHYLNGGVDLADLHLPIMINEDISLLKVLMKRLLEKEEQEGGILDQEFIQSHTQGFPELKADLDQYEISSLLKSSNLTRESVEVLVDLLAKHTKIIICWAMGLTQHENGVANIQEIVNLLLMKGSIGKPGAGTCPVRGHSNVQGDRTMGIWEKPPQKFLDKLAQEFDFSPPRAHGLDVVESIEAMHKKAGMFFMAMGGNFISASPDTEYTQAALQNCAFTVQVSTKLNRSHLYPGQSALILPCLGRTEIDLQKSGKQFVSVENSMGVVHASEGRVSPPSAQLKSEVMIIAQIAKASLKNTKTPWLSLAEHYDRIRDKIEAVIPGFENYNQRVRIPEGFYLPNGAREGKFHTTSGKAHFTLNALAQNTLKDGEYLMMTIRSHDQFNTTIYGLNDRYRGIYRYRRVVLMNREDMQAAQLEEFAEVDLVSEYQGKLRRATQFKVIPYDIPPNCLATYFPEANVLIPIHHKARKSNTPASKSVIVRIHPRRDQNA